jgi:hypothetical protein
MGTLSAMAFNPDNPSEVVAASPYTGVFYTNGDGTWRDLTPALPRPLTSVSSVAISNDAVYLATEGRGILGIAGFRNASLASYFDVDKTANSSGLIATLRDSRMIPLASAAVHLRITTTDGTAVYDANVNTNASGQLFLPQGVAPGTYVFALQFAGNANIAASETGFVHVSPTHFGVQAVNRVNAGIPFTITVTALDVNGSVVPGYRGTIHFTSTDGAAMLPADYTFTAADKGVHVFTSAVTLHTPGSQMVVVTDTITSSVTGNAIITVNALQATHFTVSAQASSIAGSAFTVTVTALDANGNTATGYTGTAHFSSSDGLALLPSNYTFTSGDGGVHVFTSAATLKTAGSQTVTATDTVNTTISGTATITVNPAAADHFSVSAPASATAGIAFSVTVTALDPFNNVATGYAGTIQFASSDGQAALSANYTFTASDDGVHAFSNGGTLRTAGQQTILAIDTMNTAIIGTATITVNPGPASYFNVNTLPNVTAGTALSVTVTARDQYGNLATGYSGTVSFSSTDGQAVLPGNYTFTAADSGSHAFSAILKTAGSQALTATDTVTRSTTGTQTGIVVNPAAASTFTVSGFLSPTTAGASGTFTVTARDPFGNIATDYAGTVSFSSTDSQAVLLDRYSFTDADNGTQTFDAILETAGTQAITATDTVNASITGAQLGIVVAPGAASMLRVSGFATPIKAGTTGTFTITAVDPYGNVATGYTGTLTFRSSDRQAVLPANYTFASADKGTQTFNASLLTAGIESITAMDTGDPSIVGAQLGIVVTPAAADHFQVDAPSTIPSGMAFDVTLTALDPYGNIDTNYTGTVTFTSSDSNPGVALPPNYSFQSSDGGVVTFFDGAALLTAGDQTLTATDTLSTISGSATVTVVPPGGGNSAAPHRRFPSAVANSLCWLHQSRLPSFRCRLSHRHRKQFP